MRDGVAAELDFGALKALASSPTWIAQSKKWRRKNYFFIITYRSALPKVWPSSLNWKEAAVSEAPGNYNQSVRNFFSLSAIVLKPWGRECDIRLWFCFRQLQWPRRFLAGRQRRPWTGLGLRVLRQAFYVFVCSFCKVFILVLCNIWYRVDAEDVAQGWYRKSVLAIWSWKIAYKKMLSIKKLGKSGV